MVSKETNLRNSVYKQTLDMAQHYERVARLRLMRMQVSLSMLEVKPPKRESMQRGLSFLQSQLSGADLRNSGML